MERRSRVQAPLIDNPDIVPYSLYLLGGAGEFVDVEELFLKCYELASERFSWRTKPLPNYKTLSKALRDYEAKHPEAMIKTQSGLGRQLSTEGLQWVERELPRLAQAFARPIAGASRVKSQRMVRELAARPVVQRYLNGQASEPTKYEMADALLCAPDSPSSVWRERLRIYRSALTAARRADLLAFMDDAEAQHPEWFGGAPR